MQSLTYLWVGAVFELFGQAVEQGASGQGQVGQEVGVAGAGAVLAHEHIPSPVIADFHPCPVSADESMPTGAGVLCGRGAGEVVARLGAGSAGLFDGALAAHHHQGASMGKVRSQRLYGPGVKGSLFDASVSGLGFDKKGVFWSRSRACARLKSLG